MSIETVRKDQSERAETLAQASMLLQVEGINYLIVYAIESPSFDVINGTTRVSDPL